MKLVHRSSISKKFVRAVGWVVIISGYFLGSVSAFSQGKVLNAKFTTTPIIVDGTPEAAWGSANGDSLAICMKADLSATVSPCPVAASVKALWNGPMLYLLFTVTDPDVTVLSSTDTNRDSVEVWVDQYNDKFPKFEDDDGEFRIAAGPLTSGSQLTGNITNAGIMTFPTVWQNHLTTGDGTMSAAGAWATSYIYDDRGKKIGYNVEIAWNIGDRPLVNGTRIGMNFSVNDAVTTTSGTTTTSIRQHRLFWSSQVAGHDDNTQWGEIVLSDYDGTSAMQLNKFLLGFNIKKADIALVTPGIWASVDALKAALVTAKNVKSSVSTQAEIDSANLALDTAIRGLRRIGKYADPYDLPEIDYLNDPFTFYDGTRVRSLADWERRREEIKDLAQYYEFGYDPGPPDTLTATAGIVNVFSATAPGFTVKMSNAGRTAAPFQVALSTPSGTGPFPVIVEIGFWPSKYDSTNPYIAAGYAIASFGGPGFVMPPRFNFPPFASDNGNHTGPFFDLFPYDLETHNDRGVLLGWAYGASRVVDGLQYLMAHDPDYANKFDLNKLAVIGFSRCGKAALLAGMLDTRFKATLPGASGSGGAAPYRYDAFGDTPYRRAPFGNVYPWARAVGSEMMGDHVRHHPHNSNEMVRRFLNDTVPAAVIPRMYKTTTHGYGTRMPFDHHLEIAAIAPRAVLIDNSSDDYPDNAEGDAIGWEGARPVYQFLGAKDKLALDIYMESGNPKYHSLKTPQQSNIVRFLDYVLKDIPLPNTIPAGDTTYVLPQQALGTKEKLYYDPYLTYAGTYDTYYGGLSAMMPWLATMPHANLLTSLAPSTGTLSPAFDTNTTTYTLYVLNKVSSIQLKAVSENPKAAITVNGERVQTGQSSQPINLSVGRNSIEVLVTAQDGVSKTYIVNVTKSDSYFVSGIDSGTQYCHSNFNRAHNYRLKYCGK